MGKLRVTARDQTAFAATLVRDERSARLASQRCALVVVDMQNDFCAEGGYINKLGKDVAVYRNVVSSVARLVDAARTSGAPVAWLWACYEDAAVPPSMRVQKRKIGVDAICCASGSWGAAPFGVEPLPAEPSFVKATYSGFSNPDFEPWLRRSGIETLVFCGVQTHVCVESTLREAHSKGFYVAVAADAVASHAPDAHALSLKTIGFLFGDVLAVADIDEAWRDRAHMVEPSKGRVKT